MERDKYSIEPVSGAWALRLNGRLLEHFDDQGRAERAACVAARLSERRGRKAEILFGGAPEGFALRARSAAILTCFSVDLLAGPVGGFLELLPS